MVYPKSELLIKRLGRGRSNIFIESHRLATVAVGSGQTKQSK